ncbi:MAG: hypothetical protein KDI33_05500 [Halioglobus sp.]|nr:hypothetical protein [Halioglobus sp.]
MLSKTSLLVLCALLCACNSPAPKRAVLQNDNSQAVDFSGSWELDYGQSDNTQQKLDSVVGELNREAKRRAQQGNMQQGAYGGGMVIGNSGANSGESILGLVRMADLITQSPLLEITQDQHKVRVKREEDFDLTCEFYPGELRRVETPFGTEICGWNGHQLVFKLLLPDGLAIQHVMTIGAAGQKLNIATTVVSSQVSFPFLLNRVYNRFEPGQSGYKCEVTLTRGTVCTTETR